MSESLCPISSSVRSVPAGADDESEDPVETSARPTIGNQCRVMQMGWDCDILDNLPGILDKGIWKMLPEYDLLD